MKKNNFLLPYKSSSKKKKTHQSLTQVNTLKHFFQMNMMKLTVLENSFNKTSTKRLS